MLTSDLLTDAVSISQWIDILCSDFPSPATEVVTGMLERILPALRGFLFNVWWQAMTTTQRLVSYAGVIVKLRRLMERSRSGRICGIILGDSASRGRTGYNRRPLSLSGCGCKAVLPMKPGPVGGRSH